MFHNITIKIIIQSIKPKYISFSFLVYRIVLFLCKSFGRFVICKIIDTITRFSVYYIINFAAKINRFSNYIFTILIHVCYIFIANNTTREDFLFHILRIYLIHLYNSLISLFRCR
nr:MAG TPA: hypothetical protein [Caudoviricetes sp.]